MAETTGLSDWIAGAGVAGYAAIGVGVLLALTALMCAVLRVSRVAAIALIVSSQIPLLIGLAGMLTGRARVDDYMRTHPEATPADRAEGEDEAQRALWIGLGTMMVCDATAVVALLRSRPPGSAPA